jgi:hypothetical protein
MIGPPSIKTGKSFMEPPEKKPSDQAEIDQRDTIKKSKSISTVRTGRLTKKKGFRN